MPEMGLSGSEGGVALITPSLPLSRPGGLPTTLASSLSVSSDRRSRRYLRYLLFNFEEHAGNHFETLPRT